MFCPRQAVWLWIKEAGELPASVGMGVVDQHAVNPLGNSQVNVQPPQHHIPQIAAAPAVEFTAPHGVAGFALEPSGPPPPGDANMFSF
jgi:hypothetical protein